MSAVQKSAVPDQSRRPLVLWVYIIGALILGFSAILGGSMLILEPSGDSLSLPLSYLQGSPFTDYLLPGIILFSVFGIGSFVVIFGVFRESQWSWHGAIGLGLAQVVWIGVEIWVIGELQFLHAVYGLLGLLLIVLALTRSVRTVLL